MHTVSGGPSLCLLDFEHSLWARLHRISPKRLPPLRSKCAAFLNTTKTDNREKRILPPRQRAVEKFNFYRKSSLRSRFLSGVVSCLLYRNVIAREIFTDRGNLICEITTHKYQPHHLASVSRRSRDRL